MEEAGRAQRDCGLRDRAFRNRRARERRAVRKWRRGRPLLAPMLLLLPAAVVHHSVLSFLDFEQLMELRVLSHALQPLVEAAAVARLGQLRSSGLDTIAWQEAGEKEEEPIQLPRTWLSLWEEEGEKQQPVLVRRLERLPFRRVLACPQRVRWSRQDEKGEDDDAGDKEMSQRSGGCSVRSLSYTVVQCFWAVQLLCCCRRINASALLEPRELSQLCVSDKHLLQRFQLGHGWDERLRSRWTFTEDWSGMRRLAEANLYTAVAVLDMLLAVYGRSVGPSVEERRTSLGRVSLLDVTEAGWRDPPPQASPHSGCPTLVITDGRRCSRCKQITAMKQSSHT